MKRIFIVDEVDNYSDEEKEVINAQIDAGVEIFVISKDNLENREQVFFFVESEGRIGWDSEIGRNQEILGK